MKSLSIFSRQSRRITAALGILLAAVAPAVVPFVASAAQLTARSIQLSSASVNATGVTYTVSFTATNAATAVVLNFCTDSPLVGTSCQAPDATFDAKTGVAASGWTVDTASSTVNKLVLKTGTISAGANTITVTGVKNPATAGTLYARIATYGSGNATTDATNAAGYTSANPDAVGAHADDGAVALSIVNAIGVSAAVLESLTFCAANAAITANCANASSNLPSITLGQGSPKALASNAISTGDIFTQLSTNAASGAVVRIKSGNTNCSGLALNNGSVCQIAAAGTSGTFTAGTAKFGVYVNPTTGSNTGTGTIALTSGSATLTGTSTAWVTTPTVKVGDTIWTAGGKTYTVQTINSDTSITLTGNASATESAAAYTYGYGSYRVYNGGGTYSDVASTYRLDDTNVKSAIGDSLLDTNSGVVNGGNVKLTFGASISNVTPAGKYSNSYSLIATGTF